MMEFGEDTRKARPAGQAGLASSPVPARGCGTGFVPARERRPGRGARRAQPCLTRRAFALPVALALAGAAWTAHAPEPAFAQAGPLRITITEGVIEPLPVAIPDFVAVGGSGADARLGQDVARVVVADLTSSGLFREVPREAHISRIVDPEAPLQYADWRAINAQAVVTGATQVSRGRLTARFRLHDAVSGQVMTGLQFTASRDDWRRVAHKIADAVYVALTGEGAYFDSQIAFVAETGPKGDRRKRLAIMDYDGENLRYLTDGDSLVLAPRISPDGGRILYTGYDSGFPRAYLLDIASRRRNAVEDAAGTMSFAPRFAPDGRTVVLSLTRAGNTDLYVMGVNGSRLRPLTTHPAVETAPSFSPDGRTIVFESDRSGIQQLYVMDARGGAARRISFGEGRYGTPVWSPRGDLIAFTKQNRGRFHIGVMRVDGSGERLLTASFLDEGPTWAPNGRVIMFARETPGAAGRSLLYSVDITGRNLRVVPTPDGASDPTWSAIRP